MEWLALAVWALAAAFALPAGAGAFAAPALGLVPPLGLAGLALSVIFAAGGAHSAGLMWVAFGLGLAGAVVTGAGAAQLIAEEQPGSPEIGRAEEHGSVFAGIAWPLLAVAAGVSVLAALAADGTL
ncbi:MAG: hypothetical protein JSS99_14585 [Actinobacteria bacterium]|nr:hypothetical protein [Actinomycetota bacterium]